MILFALNQYETMGAAFERTLPGLRTGEFHLARFDNGELYASIHSPVNVRALRGPGLHCTAG